MVMGNGKTMILWSIGSTMGAHEGHEGCIRDLTNPLIVSLERRLEPPTLLGPITPVGSHTPLNYHLSQNQLVMENGRTMGLWYVGCIRKAFEHHSTMGAHEGCTRDLIV